MTLTPFRAAIRRRARESDVSCIRQPLQARGARTQSCGALPARSRRRTGHVPAAGATLQVDTVGCRAGRRCRSRQAESSLRASRTSPSPGSLGPRCRERREAYRLPDGNCLEHVVQHGCRGHLGTGARPAEDEPPAAAIQGDRVLRAVHWRQHMVKRYEGRSDEGLEPPGPVSEDDRLDRSTEFAGIIDIRGVDRADPDGFD